MSQPLPTGGLKWTQEVPTCEGIKEHIQKYVDGPIGALLEVDLEYPKELHDLHNELPLAVEKVRVTEDMRSPYCKKIKNKFDIPVGSVEKLIPNLTNKDRYVVHARNLDLYLSLGLHVTKVHKVLEFNQSPWLKSYIDLNTEKRKTSFT